MNRNEKRCLDEFEKIVKNFYRDLEEYLTNLGSLYRPDIQTINKYELLGMRVETLRSILGRVEQEILENQPKGSLFKKATEDQE